jgi:hypothetical protein
VKDGGFSALSYHQKTANILDKMPKGVQSKAKRMLHDIYQAETREQARKAYALGCSSREATLSMVFKLCQEAEKNWRTLDGAKWIPLVLEGKRFVDAELDEDAA